MNNEKATLFIYDLKDLKLYQRNRKYVCGRPFNVDLCQKRFVHVDWKSTTLLRLRVKIPLCTLK